MAITIGSLVVASVPLTNTIVIAVIVTVEFRTRSSIVSIITLGIIFILLLLLLLFFFSVIAIGIIIIIAIVVTWLIVVAESRAQFNIDIGAHHLCECGSHLARVEPAIGADTQRRPQRALEWARAHHEREEALGVAAEKPGELARQRDFAHAQDRHEPREKFC
jgi:hypothetical protein